MASRRYAAAILIAVCLDASSIVADVAATVARHPKTPRYEGYRLERGPVFYEAYYPDTRDAADQREQHLDPNAVLERSFQVPFERLAHSAGTADRRVPTNGSLFVMSNAKAPSGEQRGVIKSRRDYGVADNVGERTVTPYNDGGTRSANIEDISELVRRAISRDLENWSALERYLERAANQVRLQPYVYSGENTRGGYGFRVERRSYDSSGQPGFGAPEESEARHADDPQRPTYLERIVSEDAASDGDVIPESLPPVDNIFQPRPQVIRYTFFRKPAARPDENTVATIASSTPRNYGDNLIREELADSRGRERDESVKVTSVEVSELPRHKTRHHHGEWPKRDYSTHRRQSADRPTL